MNNNSKEYSKKYYQEHKKKRATWRINHPNRPSVVREGDYLYKREELAFERYARELEELGNIR